MNYAINSDRGSSAMAEVRAVVEDAGGVVLTQYAPIGVTVAQSTRSEFAHDLRALEDVIDSVGATRTSAVDAVRVPAPDPDELGEGVIESEPREGEQWGNWVLQSPAANRIEDGKRSVLVGVLDSGIQDRHEDLAVNFNRAASVNCASDNGVPNTEDGAWRPASSTHGTHVAGTVAAARNGKGIAGIAPGVEVASIVVGDANNFIFPEYAMCGFMWAAKQGVDITNSSYFIDPWMFWCQDDPDQGAVQESMRRVIAYTHRQGMINVASAGNEHYDLAHKTTDDLSPNDSVPYERVVDEDCLQLPTELEGVIAVAATDRISEQAGFSNYGKHVIDVAAPGVYILSTAWPGTGRYVFMNGTSMASPHVAGVLALMESAEPGRSRR